MASSGCGDAETEDSQGVEGDVSAMQSQFYPPKKQTKSKCHKHSGESKHSRAKSKRAKKKKDVTPLVYLIIECKSMQFYPICCVYTQT